MNNLKLSKIIILLLLIFLNSSLFSYNIGDYADDITFEDIDWGMNNIPEYSQKSLSQLTAEGKTVVIYFFDITFA